MSATNEFWRDQHTKIGDQAFFRNELRFVLLDQHVFIAVWPAKVLEKYRVVYLTSRK